MNRRLVALIGVFAFVACSRDTSGDTEPPAAPARGDDFQPTAGAWHPGQSVPTDRGATARGLLDRKGLVHAHSVYSHDACDGKPRDANGNIDRTCLDQFRKAICTTKLDFVFLTDHRGAFADTDFPDVVLHDATRGDRLAPESRANWAACEMQDPVLLMAGTESGTTPVGLEHHVAGTHDERMAKYDSKSPEAIDELKKAGAVSLVVHTEDWTADQLATMPIDGFEMYNLHANAFLGVGALIGIIGHLKDFEANLPQPDLFLLPVVSEDPKYLATWGSVLARGVHRVTTMGTDCHRNSFPQITSDGERIDSYQRMMGWFSNHLLVRPDAGGIWNDRSLKDALRGGRLYGTFDVLGNPTGFDFHATESDHAAQVREMGDEAVLANGVTLHVTMPSLERLDPKTTAPSLTARILRAREGGWDVVATSSSSIDFVVPSAGAYRAEIRMTPRHLEHYLGDYAELARSGDFVWVYADAIYVK